MRLSHLAVLWAPAVLLAATPDQQIADLPSFEVASITPCKPDTPEPRGERLGMVQFIKPGGRFEAKETSLKFLMEWSWGIIPSQHSSGPAWMDDARYDIVAKAAPGASEKEIRRMVQRLVVESFQLRFHIEQRQMPVIAISQGKTAPKLYAPKTDEKHSISVKPQPGPDGKVRTWHVVATRYSFADLNQTFSRQLERVIVNQTGMDGDFDFALDMTPDDDTPNPLDPTIVLNAMRDQLGLVVKSQKLPVDFYVIDGAEKVLRGN